MENALFAFLFWGASQAGRGNLLEPPRPVACGGVALITSLARAAGRYLGAVELLS